MNDVGYVQGRTKLKYPPWGHNDFPGPPWKREVCHKADIPDEIMYKYLQ